MQQDWFRFISCLKAIVWCTPGLCLGVNPAFFGTLLSKVTQNHPFICFYFYADDTQLYIFLTHKHATQAFDMLKHCLGDVKKWLSKNKPKLTPDKTEFILFGLRTVRRKLNKLNIFGNLLSSAEVIQNLGIWFDFDFFLLLPCQEYL